MTWKRRAMADSVSPLRTTYVTGRLAGRRWKTPASRASRSGAAAGELQLLAGAQRVARLHAVHRRERVHVHAAAAGHGPAACRHDARRARADGQQRRQPRRPSTRAAASITFGGNAAAAEGTRRSVPTVRAPEGRSLISPDDVRLGVELARDSGNRIALAHRVNRRARGAARR